jgi:hypothetical protein
MDDWERARQRAITIYGCVVAALLALFVGAQFR